MNKTLLGKTNMEVSQIIYGGIVSMSDGQELSDQYVEYAVNNGINYFDVAPSYGDAQEKLGNSLVPYRKSVYLACKTGMRTAEEAKKELNESLNLLHTDYFDIYQMHALSSIEDVDAAFSNGGCFEIMLKAKEEGIVKNLGITCHSEDAAVYALSLYAFDTVLFPTNWELHMKKGFGGKIAAYCKSHNIGFLGMKSMIHRAWYSDDEKNQSTFTKSWCKPISDNDELAIAAMKYAYSIGASALVPPGNIKSFTFAVEYINEISKPLTEAEIKLLNKELIAIDDHFFF